MPGLQRQLIAVPLTGLQTKADPKSAPIGLLSIAENCWASRRTAGGFELRKRYGYSPLTNALAAGGTIATGRRLGVLEDELVLCDGLQAYSLSLALNKWFPRGRAQDIAARVAIVSGNEASAGVDVVEKVNVDRAEANGYACTVSSPDSSTFLLSARVVIEDLTTGKAIATKVHGTGVYRARVVTIGNAFYVFCWSGGSKIFCQKIDTATPTTFGALTDVATNVHASGLFDVIVDSTNARMVVGYRNTAPTLTLAIWTTGMTAGTSAAFASVDPDACIGFLVHNFANGSGYVGVGKQSNAVRLLTFDASTMVVGTNTLLETGTEVPSQITGYNARVSSTDHLNVFWSVTNGFVLGHNTQIRASGDGTLYTVMSSVGLASRPFKLGAKWHMFAGYQTDSPFSRVHQTGQQRTFLLELTENAQGTASGYVNVSGYLLANDSTGLPVSPSCLPSVTMPTGTSATFGACGILSIGTDVGIFGTQTASQQRYTVLRLSLDWSGAGLGRPVSFNGVLHLPGAAAKIYDGYSVVEEGFYVNPEQPYGASTATTSGQLTLLGTYQYCVVFARADKSGRLIRSAPGPVRTVTMAGTTNEITLRIPTLRVTDAYSLYNLNPDVTQVRIEIYRTQADLENFFLCQVLTNNPQTDFLTIVDGMSDANLEKNEFLYTNGGALDHIFPPAVRVFHKHGGRLWAITADQAIWHSKAAVDGLGSEFSDDLRFKVEEGDGAPLAMASVDTTMAIFKAEKTLLLQGAGPDEKGNNPFGRPVGLQDDVGALGPGSVIETSGGALVRSGKSWFLLGRDLGLRAVEEPAGYDSLIPAFGAPVGGAPTGGRSQVVIPTQGDALVFDWQLGQFFTSTGPASFLAGVCSVRWRNSLLILKSDGTVLQEVVGQYFDGTNTPIAERVKVAWLELGKAHVDKALITAEFPASTTVTTTLARDRDEATAASKTKAVTAGSKTPIVHAPNTGRASAIEVLIEESSTTEGIRISQIDLLVALEPGTIGHKSSAYAT